MTVADSQELGDRGEFSSAQRLYQAGDWRGALDAFTHLLQQRLDADVNLTIEDQVATERLADLAVMFERPQAAMSLLAGLAELSCRRGDRFLEAYFILKQADAAVSAADFNSGETALRTQEIYVGPLDEIPTEPALLPAWESRCRWIVRAEHDRPLLFSRLYLALGGWLSGCGFYRQAAVLLQRGTMHAEPPASSLACRAWVRLHLALAGAELEYGSLAEVDAVLKKTKPAIDPKRHPGWWSQWLGLAGHAALLKGDFGPALDHLREATVVCGRGGFYGAVLTSLLHRARVLIALNQVLAAEDALDEASQLIGNSQTAKVRVAWLRRLARNRGESPIGDGQHHTVTGLWDYGGHKALEISAPDDHLDPLQLPAAPNYLAFFEDRALAVRWRLARGMQADAKKLLAQLRQTYAASDSLLIRLRLDALDGAVAYAQKDYAAAERMFKGLVSYLKTCELRPELRDAQRFLWWCAQRNAGAPGTNESEGPEARKDGDSSILSLGSEVRELTDQMANTLPASERAIYLLDKWADEERQLAGELVAWNEYKARAAQAPWWTRSWRRWQVRRGLLKYLDRLTYHRNRESELASGVSTTVSLRGTNALSMPANQITLVFQVLPEFTFVARVSSRVLDARVVPLTRVRVRELVARWHRHIALGNSRIADLSSIADELAISLGINELIQDLPSKITRLAIIADDALHGFPFAAIRIGSKSRYLIEDFALSYRHDVSVSRAPIRPIRSAMVVAIPDGSPPSAEFPFGVPPLPNVVSESADVSKRLAAAGIRLRTPIGPDINATALLAAWTEVDFIHIACHGIFHPDEPDRSGLVIVGAGGATRLTLRQLLETDLRRVEHVSLSCCWGADNFVLPGRRILSLPEAICRAGAGSVLAALWTVDDVIGRKFARGFQKYARRFARDEALRRVQCDFVRDTAQTNPLSCRRPVSHPYFWAGYRLHGRPGYFRWPEASRRIRFGRG